ncbi:hypothetical protein SADUNF_Sadunf14G0082000 [Salix dunnii]|uniref:Uncharacterized protein n=1 Tax=Salix dunnii TaxID=1413687 RepID=A0A835JIN7_9ROSI|nr:hypothetical protein SADUNF_Sadunf14G0082000 [Salix dunnii]
MRNRTELQKIVLLRKKSTNNLQLGSMKLLVFLNTCRLCLRVEGPFNSLMLYAPITKFFLFTFRFLVFTSNNCFKLEEMLSMKSWREFFAEMNFILIL